MSVKRSETVPLGSSGMPVPIRPASITTGLPARRPPSSVAAQYQATSLAWICGCVRRSALRRVLERKLFQPHRVPPGGDQTTEGLANRPDPTVEVVQSGRDEATVVLAQRGVPVDNVGQAVPGKADDRNAVLLPAVHAGPLLL